MSGPAELRLDGVEGVFLAERCELGDGTVTATGRWRWRRLPADRFGERQTFTWPTRRVSQIRWLAPELIAAAA